MKPFDPRLLRHARQAAVYIAVLVALGTAAAGLIIAQAQLLSGAIAGAVDHGATLSSLRGIIIALAAVLAGRALIAWATEAASYRASAAVKSQLRRQVLARAAALGPRWLAGRRSAELTALAADGIDALDGYFSRYLPQLILAVIVPVAVLIWVGAADLLSGVIILVTLPLIPLFGALVGMATGAHAQRRWEALARLSHHFLDVVTGLPTLKVFGRSREQRASIAKVTGEYRRRPGLFRPASRRWPGRRNRLRCARPVPIPVTRAIRTTGGGRGAGSPWPACWGRWPRSARSACWPRRRG